MTECCCGHWPQEHNTTIEESRIIHEDGFRKVGPPCIKCTCVGYYEDYEWSDNDS